MNAQEIYDLLVAHLDNGICNPQTDKMGKLKRMKLPIPEEYGGGVATGYGYEETIRNLIERVKDQIKMESNSPTFKESWTAWIKLKSGQERSPNTIANYRYIARVHLLPFFEEKHIDQITPDDIQLFFNGIRNKSKSVNDQCKAILSGIFDRAVRMGHVKQNIMLYKYERSRKEGKKTARAKRAGFSFSRVRNISLNRKGHVMPSPRLAVIVNADSRHNPFLIFLRRKIKMEVTREMARAMAAWWGQKGNWKQIYPEVTEV